MATTRNATSRLGIVASLLMAGALGCESSDGAAEGGDAGPGVPPGDYDYNTDIKWTTVQKYSTVTLHTKTFQDVMSHCDPNDLNKCDFPLTDPLVAVHENNHMLDAQISGRAGWGDNAGIYYKDGKAVVFTIPKTKVSEVVPFVPASVVNTSSRYDLYVLGQGETNLPTDLGWWIDEMSSYHKNGTMAEEAVNAGTYVWNTVAEVEGCIDFVNFNGAALVALQAKEPNYLATNLQYKAVLALFTEECMALAKRAEASGNDKLILDGGKTLLNNLRSAADMKPIRDGFGKLYGSGWVKRVLIDK